MTHLRGVNLLIVGMLGLALAGCRTLPTGPDPDDVPSYAELAEVHNERVGRLKQVYSRGVIELSWRDEDGSHFEQGNIDLWLDLPRRTALRVEKLGNVFLWLGSDEQRFWLFDMLGDETVLLTAGHNSPLQGEGLLTVRPLVLLDLVGLTPLRAPLEGVEPPVRYDRATNGWVVTAPGQGGVMRLFLDRSSLLPVRIQSIDAAGEVVYQSVLKLDRYRSVPRPGAPPSEFARMATLVDVTAASQPEAGITRGQLKLALDEPTGRVDDQPMSNVFDLQRLMQSMRPDRIEGEAPTISSR